ncbi:MAG TPA: hypothetical protein VJC18_10830, partial [bacterium]|nr:hypothetical protein [bacterium]
EPAKAEGQAVPAQAQEALMQTPGDHNDTQTVLLETALASVVLQDRPSISPKEKQPASTLRTSSVFKATKVLNDYTEFDDQYIINDNGGL